MSCQWLRLTSAGSSWSPDSAPTGIVPGKRKIPGCFQKGKRKARDYDCALTGIRTPVLGLKGPRPSPLDDEGDTTGGILPPGEAGGKFSSSCAGTA